MLKANIGKLTYSELKQKLDREPDITPFSAQVMLQKYSDIKLGCPFCHRNSDISHVSHWVHENPDVDIEHLTCGRCGDLLPNNYFVSMTAAKIKRSEPPPEIPAWTFYLCPRKPTRREPTFADMEAEFSIEPMGEMGLMVTSWDVPFREMLSKQQIDSYDTMPEDYE